MSVFEKLKARKNQAIGAVALSILSGLAAVNIPTESSVVTEPKTNDVATVAQDQLCKGYIDKAIALEAARLRNGDDNLAKEKAYIAKFKEDCQ